MEPGALELQIFVSLVVILGAAFVALVCDFLKRNNEQLREHNIELRVRKEEHEKSAPAEAVTWLQNLIDGGRASRQTRVPVRRAAQDVPSHRHTAPARVAPQTTEPTPVEQTPAVVVPPVAVPDVAPVWRPRPPRPRRDAAEAASSATLVESLALPEWLKKEHEERAALKAQANRETVTPAPVDPAEHPKPATLPPPAPEPAPAARWNFRNLLDRVVAVTTMGGHEPAPAVEVEVPVTAQAVAGATASAPVPAPAVEVLIEKLADPVAASTPEALPEPVPQAPVAADEFELPTGFQDRLVLARLMESSASLTGVVVSIGINDYQRTIESSVREGSSDLVRSVEALIGSLLRAQDFVCRSSEDEFLLIYPKESGADAQRRLSMISERLWDFQLRSIAAVPVMFSWGAVEVQGETLADAVASARERMYQTKRNRKTVAFAGQRPQRKKVVNQ